MLKGKEQPRKFIRNERQRMEVMLARIQNRQASDLARRPLYESIWLAFFELLRDELAARMTPALSRGGSLSPRQ